MGGLIEFVRGLIPTISSDSANILVTSRLNEIIIEDDLTTSVR